jgi:uncharacterized protein (TIGR04255 family)
VIENPLTSPPPAEVPLPHSPLIRVLAQIRFPTIASIEKIEFIAGFQEAIRQEYSILRQQKTQHFIVDGDDPNNPTSKEGVIWSFSNENYKWTIHLTNNFIALETTAYTSRAEFLEKLEFVLTSLETHIKPGHIDRIGVRYVDRIQGEDLILLPKLIRPEVLGIFIPTLESHIDFNICETHFELPSTNDQSYTLVTRWGKLPAGYSFDHRILDVIDKPSWILDLDMSSGHNSNYSVQTIITVAKQFMERLYTFFRWVVTDEFLRKYGSDV